LLNRKLEQLEQKKIDLETIRKKLKDEWIIISSIGVVNRKKRFILTNTILENRPKTKAETTKVLENTPVTKFQSSKH
jgi:hypothetical protein